MVAVRESTVRACFHIKLLIFFFESVAFTRITCTEQELSFRISQISEYVLCGYYILLFIFLQKRSCKARKDKPTKKANRYQNSSDMKQAPARKRTDEKMFYTLSQQITEPSYKLTLLASECVFHKFYYLD